jgi:hypothetical protein
MALPDAPVGSTENSPGWSEAQSWEAANPTFASRRAAANIPMSRTNPEMCYKTVLANS